MSNKNEIMIKINKKRLKRKGDEMQEMESVFVFLLEIKMKMAHCTNDKGFRLASKKYAAIDINLALNQIKVKDVNLVYICI